MPRALTRFLLLVLAAGCSEPRITVAKRLVDIGEVDASGMRRLDEEATRNLRALGCIQ